MAERSDVEPELSGARKLLSPFVSGNVWGTLLGLPPKDIMKEMPRNAATAMMTIRDTCLAMVAGFGSFATGRLKRKTRAGLRSFVETGGNRSAKETSADWRLD